MTRQFFRVNACDLKVLKTILFAFSEEAETESLESQRSFFPQLICEEIGAPDKNNSVYNSATCMGYKTESRLLRCAL